MIKPIVVILVGIASLIVQMIYFIKDDRTSNTDTKDKPFKIRWHFAGGLLHVWMYYTISEIHGKEWGLVMASLTWFMFDGCINSYALGKEFFYVGKTAIIDKAQQWIAMRVGIDPRLVSGVLKVSFLIASIFTVIKFYANG